MMRVGILGHAFVDWGGGIDFLRVVMASLHQARPDLELHLLVPDGQLRPPLVRLYRGLMRKDRQPQVRRPAASHIDELAGSVGGAVTIHRVAPDRYALARLARELSLDVLMPAHNPLPADFPFPWVGYIADFQHRYLPQLFSKEECRSRDAHFSAMLMRARTVIVNSRAAARDIERFHPGSKARIFTLPFSAAPQAAWLEPSTGVQARYGIHRRYFLIANQFWKHKDHGTAFAAFAAIADRHPDIHLVCTGPTDDYRDPNHFPALKKFLHDHNIAERVHVLGMIPKSDQIELMTSSIALLQPTLFEGGPGGGAVYDAVSLGVPCLVSDIEVNRELDESLVAFFSAGDSAELASHMIEALNQPHRPARDAKSLHQSGVARRIASGRTLLESIDHARSS
ncbi:glycosyltransferase family 1 protein [Variovorax dokdonensis]|uniref:Glycosyltransferase family 1 protein n=1 Tax=Variovorax dokdonensis TaxID=344883 RepID=A0ABT7N9K2_9BURK|nr:glycosyltransferase family 1 protein [Variovorax dokdonensis]MDM0044624.1 glycosyltransferase family 1 protein [Variovorax dokdonensis]